MNVNVYINRFIHDLKLYKQEARRAEMWMRQLPSKHDPVINRDAVTNDSGINNLSNLLGRHRGFQCFGSAAFRGIDNTMESLCMLFVISALLHFASVHLFDVASSFAASF